MSETKFTPGPWQVNGSHIYGPDPSRELVAQAHASGEGAWTSVGGSRMVSNRNLIAAAPEMYEALRSMVSDGAFEELCQTIGEEPEWLKLARAALAKAVQP